METKKQSTTETNNASVERPKLVIRTGVRAGRAALVRVAID